MPVEIREKLGRAPSVALVGKPVFQKIFKFREYILRQLFFGVEAVLDAVEPLFVSEVEQVVDRHSEAFRDCGKQGDIRHRRAVFPF